MPLETLENPFWKLVISPEFGASPVALEHRLNNAWVPIMRPSKPGALEAGRSADFASYTLAPYSNRIPGGAFEFRGQQHRLRPNWPDGQTIHGDVRDAPWAVTRHADALECRIASDAIPNANFPFPYALRCTYRLEGTTFATELELTNTGGTAMPAGLGIHPYFERRVAGSGDGVLGFTATRWYVASDPSNPVPTGPATPIPEAVNFSAPRAPGDQFVDAVFTGWDGSATLEWPGSGKRLRITADEVFSHFVVFTAPDGTLALEPVTNATDGFNLMARGVPGTGVVVLEPGETLVGRIAMTLEDA